MRMHGGDLVSNQNVLLDFSVNVNPFGIPKKVKDAAKYAVEQCDQYPDPQCRKLRKKLSARYAIPESFVCCGNGASDLIFRLVYARKPKKAILFAPTFSEYEAALKTYGCEIKYIYLSREHDFIPDDHIFTELHDADMVFFCNPNNPTGQAMSRQWIEKLAQQCAQNKSTLCLDECFVEFLDNDEDATFMPMLTQYPNVFLLRAFTKTFAIAGLRLGFACCSDTDFLQKVAESGPCWNVSIPAQQAGIAAIDQKDYFDDCKLKISEERNWLKKQLLGLGFEVIGSHANYIFFRGKTNDLKQQLLQHHILVRDCLDYRGLDEYDYRISVKTHAENKSLVDALKVCKR